MTSRQEPARISLTTRLLVVGAFSALALIVVMTLLVDRSLRGIWLGELDDDLETIALMTAEGLPESPDGYQDWAERMADSGSVRVTIVDPGGVVLADSHQDPATMENHADRPEVIAALDGEVGAATRVSESTGIDQRYVAVPPASGVVVRVSSPISVFEDQLEGTRGAINRVALVVAAIALAALAVLGRRLARPVTELADQARSIAAGDLDVTPAHYQTRELDRLATSLAAIARDLGGRVTEAEQSSAMLEVVLGAIPQGTILFSDDHVVYANQAAGQILGVIPATLSELTPLQLQTAVREARESGAQVGRVVDHDRPARRVRGVATPFADSDRVLLVLADVTERERIDAIRRDFVANASHELKTPVATIIAASEAMQIAMSRGDESAMAFATQIEASARQLDRLVADLLDLSRLEREQPELLPVRLDLLVAREVDRIGERAADNGLTLATELEETVVMGSEADLGVATHNLLDNAIRYTPAGGRVEVGVAVAGRQAVLTVRDTGVGIPSRDLERVFERFYRVDSARSRVTGGTGLGLSIVRHVAETHGGSVAVESELGAGSTFTLELPVGNGQVPGPH
jgi:two-component system phosphate regulon sensor histidine kinase PhoR